MNALPGREDPALRFLQTLASGRWDAAVLADAERALLAAHTAATVCAALDLLSASRGVGEEALASLLDASARLSAGVSMRCEAIARHQGHEELATRARGCRSRLPDPRVARWPTCLAHEPRPVPWQHATRADARSLMTRQVDLHDWLAPQTAGQSAARIAVIGNAPGALQGARGVEIDACDVVIRFNNGLPTQATRDALGARTDLHVVSPGALPALRRRGAIDPHRPLCLTGNPGWTRPSGYWRRALAATDATLVTVPAATWRGLVSVLSAPPTAGLLLRAALADADPDRLLLHGFDPEGSARGARNHHADKAAASTRHDLAAEARWLRERASD